MESNWDQDMRVWFSRTQKEGLDTQVDIGQTTLGRGPSQRISTCDDKRLQ